MVNNVIDIPWLDDETRALVRDLITSLISVHPDLLGVIVYGSVARHTERPLTEPDPSDVDLLAFYDTEDEHIMINPSFDVTLVHYQTVGRHLDAPREVSLLPVSRNLKEWDETFVAHIAKDGIALYIRDQLPALVHACTSRAIGTISG